MAIEIKGVDSLFFAKAVWDYAKVTYSDWAAGKDENSGVAAVQAVMVNSYTKEHVNTTLKGDALLKAAATEFYAKFGADWGLAPNEFFNATEYKAAWIKTLLETDQAMDANAVSADFDKAVSEVYGGDSYAHYLAEGANITLADGSIIGVNPSNKFDDSLYMEELVAKYNYKDMNTLRLDSIKYKISPLGFFVDYPRDQVDSTPPEVPTGERVNVDDNVTTGSKFTLTNGTDTATANIFNAGLVYTPGGDDRINSLQNEDKLTGEGENPTLNATLGNANDNGDAIITPNLNKIEIVNVDFTGNTANADWSVPVVALDVQDANALTDININRISQSTNTGRIENIKQKDLNLMSIANTHANNVGTVEFSYATGVLRGANSSTLKLNDVQVLNVNIGENTSLSTAAGVGVTGYETLNIASIGATNTVGVLNLPMDTGVTGTVKAIHSEDKNGNNLDQTLNLIFVNPVVTAVNNTTNVEAVIYGGGINLAQGRIAAIDASELQASLSLAIGRVDNVVLNNPAGTDGADILTTGKADTSGVTQDVTITGTANADVFYLNDFLQAGDVINGGDGADRVVVYSQGNVGRISSVETVDVQIDGSRVAGNDTITLNFANIADATLESVRNVTNRPFDANADGVLDARLAGDDAANQTVNLYNLTAAQAVAINIAHSTTANNGIGDTTLNATLAADTAADSITVTINEGVNIDPRFNFTLDNITAAPASLRQAIETLNIVDNDSESNSIALTNSANYTGTININGPGAAGKFVNFDNGVLLKSALVDNNTNGQQAGSFEQRGGYNLDVDGMENDYSTAAPGTNGAIAATNVDTVMSGTPGLTANVRYNTLDNGVPGEIRLIAQTFNASTETADVIARFGDVTRTNGVSSMSITGGSGNDTFIFDAQGVKNSGYTSADTVAGGVGLDTLVIDGNTTVAPPVTTLGNVSVQKSEWDKTTGIDVLRVAGNQGFTNGSTSVPGNRQIVNSDINSAGYYIEIDNEFVKQTDSGNNLRIINNDGDLATNFESDLILNLRVLEQGANITFVGANSTGTPGIASNRVQLEDNSANGANTLNGGDTNVREGTAAQSTGNNNVLEIFNAADVSIDDLSKTSNFGRIEATNDTATPKTLKLVLNNTVMDQLVDTSQNASATNIERLVIVANNNDNVNGAVENLAISGAGVTNTSFGLEILVGRNSDNNITGTAGRDRVYIQGNYTDEIDAATLRVINEQAFDRHSGRNIFASDIFANTASEIDASFLEGNGIVYRGGDGRIATRDDQLLLDTSDYNLGLGDTIEIYGGVSFIDTTNGNRASITPGTALRVHSEVRLTESQFTGMNTITFAGGNQDLNGDDQFKNTDRNGDGKIEDIDTNNDNIFQDYETKDAQGNIQKVIEQEIEVVNTEHAIIITDDKSTSVDLSKITMEDPNSTLFIIKEGKVDFTNKDNIKLADGANAPIILEELDAKNEHSPTVEDSISFDPIGKNTTTQIEVNLAKDMDGDKVTIVSILNDGDVKDGKASLGSNGSILFEPTKDYVGAVSFRAVVSDKRGGYDITTLTGEVSDKTPGTIAWPTDLVFNEDVANNGLITETIKVTLTDDLFTPTAVPTFSKSLEDLGLTGKFTVDSIDGHIGYISLTGNAKSHAIINDVQNLTVSFGADDFVNGVVAKNATNTLKIAFIDAPEDKIAPTLASSTPTDNEKDVAINSDITLVFSEAIKLPAQSAGTPPSIGLMDSANQPLKAALTPSPDGKSIVINPETDFKAGSDYHVVIADTVTDIAGNKFDVAKITADGALNFTTKSDGAATIVNFDEAFGSYTAEAGKAEIITVDLAAWTKNLTLTGFDIAKDKLIINTIDSQIKDANTDGKITASDFIAGNGLSGDEAGSWAVSGQNVLLLNKEMTTLSLETIVNLVGTPTLTQAEEMGWIQFI